MAERRKSKRHLKRVRIRLQYPDIQTFIEKYSTNISRGGVFIQTREPKPQDTHIRFELLLANGEPALRGEGKVIWVKDPDPDAPDKPCGMGVKFTKVDRKTSEVIAKIIEFKKRQSSSATTDQSDAHDEAPSEEKDSPSEGEASDEDPPIGSQPKKDSEDDKEAADLEDIESQPEKDSENDKAAADLEDSTSQDEEKSSEESDESLVEEDDNEQKLSLDLDESEENEPNELLEAESQRELQGPVSELAAAVQQSPVGEAVQERLVEALMVDSEDGSDADKPVVESPTSPERRSSSPPLAEVRGTASPPHFVGEVTGWPPWMNEPIDVYGILGRAIGAKPVVGNVVDTELGKLQPDGFDLSVTLEKLVGTIAAAKRVIVAPRTIAREQPAISEDQVSQDPVGEGAASKAEFESAEPVEAHSIGEPTEPMVEAEPAVTLRQEIPESSMEQGSALGKEDQEESTDQVDASAPDEEVQEDSTEQIEDSSPVGEGQGDSTDQVAVILETPIDESTAEVDATVEAGAEELDPSRASSEAQLAAEVTELGGVVPESVEEAGDLEASSYKLDPFDDDEAATELEMNAFSEADDHVNDSTSTPQVHGVESQSVEADPSAYRREEDPTTNLYDLAREEDSLNALISPEEFPDMMDDLMMGEDDGLQATPRTVPEPSDQDVTRQSQSYDESISPAGDQAAGEFEEYELIDDEDIGSSSPIGETLQGTGGDGAVADENFLTAAPDDFPVYTPAPTSGQHSEADDALSELFGISSAAPNDNGRLDSNLLDEQSPTATVDDLPPLFAEDAVEDETVVQQEPHLWNQGDGRGAPQVVTSATSDATAQPSGSVAGSQEFHAPGVPEVMVSSELDHEDQTIFDPYVQQVAVEHDDVSVSDDSAAVEDGTQEDTSGKKKGFFRKLFGGGEG